MLGGISSRDVVNFTNYMSFFQLAKVSQAFGISSKNKTPELTDAKDIITRSSAVLTKIINSEHVTPAVTGKSIETIPFDVSFDWTKDRISRNVDMTASNLVARSTSYSGEMKFATKLYEGIDCAPSVLPMRALKFIVSLIANQSYEQASYSFPYRLRYLVDYVQRGRSKAYFIGNQEHIAYIMNRNIHYANAFNKLTAAHRALGTGRHVHANLATVADPDDAQKNITLAGYGFDRSYALSNASTKTFNAMRNSTSFTADPPSGDGLMMPKFSYQKVNINANYMDEFVSALSANIEDNATAPAFVANRFTNSRMQIADHLQYGYNDTANFEFICLDIEGQMIMLLISSKDIDNLNKADAMFASNLTLTFGHKTFDNYDRLKPLFDRFAVEMRGLVDNILNRVTP